MKNLKVILASLLLVVGVVAFSAFKAESYNKNAFAVVCFYYVGVQPPTPTSIQTASNWSPTSVTPPIAPLGLCNGGQVLCAICIDDSQLDEDDRPIAAILTAVKDHYQDSQTGGVVITTVNSTTVTIYFKASA